MLEYKFNEAFTTVKNLFKDFDKHNKKTVRYPITLIIPIVDDIAEIVNGNIILPSNITTIMQEITVQCDKRNLYVAIDVIYDKRIDNAKYDIVTIISKKD